MWQAGNIDQLSFDNSHLSFLTLIPRTGVDLFQLKTDKCQMITDQYFPLAPFPTAQFGVELVPFRLRNLETLCRVTLSLNYLTNSMS
jgi:hypothetical protein